MNSSGVLSRVLNIANSSGDPGRLEEEEHQARALHRSNHLHVDVSNDIAWAKRNIDETCIANDRSPGCHEGQCLESWNHEKVKRKRDHTHFNADSSNTELLFHLFSISGAVSNWCY